MKIVNIIGGLGNQMFQYAFAMALKKKHANEDVRIDISHFNGYPLHNGYELNDVFNGLTIKTATAKQIWSLSYYVPRYKLWRLARKFLPKRTTEYFEPNTCVFYEEALLKEGDCYYEGYWQCAPYFREVKEELVKEFAFANIKAENISLADQMKKENSVGLHVRRGDYLKEEQYQGICDLHYYQQAIELPKSTGNIDTYYIFSNDMQWCKDNLQPMFGNSKVVYVTQNAGKDSYQDMYLMQHCKHLIIANSSFSWWGAFLNRQGGTIVSPKKWKNLPQQFDVQDENWTLI